MQLSIDIGTLMTAIGFFTLVVIFFWSINKLTTKVLDEVNNRPEMPDLGQLGELESKTQFKVVTKDSYDALESGMKSNKETPIKLDKVRRDFEELDSKFDQFKATSRKTYAGLLQGQKDLSLEVQKIISELEKQDANLKLAFENLFSVLSDEEDY